MKIDMDGNSKEEKPLSPEEKNFNRLLFAFLFPLIMGIVGFKMISNGVIGITVTIAASCAVIVNAIDRRDKRDS